MSDYGLTDDQIEAMSPTDGLGMAIEIMCALSCGNYNGVLARDIADLKGVLRNAKESA